MHERYINENFDRILTIYLDDFITEKKEKNVKRIVTDFTEKFPEYTSYRSDIYKISCQILETHKEEDVEKELVKKINSFIKIRKRKNVDDILKGFLRRYPKYKKDRALVYEKICEILGRRK